METTQRYKKGIKHTAANESTSTKDLFTNHCLSLHNIHSLSWLVRSPPDIKILSQNYRGFHRIHT